MVFQRLRDLREDRDLTQKEIAAILNVSQNTYSQYETGKITLTAEVLLTLSEFYGVSTDYLLGKTDHEARISPHRLVIFLADGQQVMKMR